MVTKKSGGSQEDSKMSDAINTLFANKTATVGGSKSKKNLADKKGKKGGISITPFLSALALLGTRIINDKRFYKKDGKFDPFINVNNEKYKKNKYNRRSRVYGGGEDDGNTLNPDENAHENVDEIAAKTIGGASKKNSRKHKLRKSRRGRMNGGENDPVPDAPPDAPPDDTPPDPVPPATPAPGAGGAEQDGGRRKRSYSTKKRAASPKRRAASPKRRAASPKRRAASPKRRAA